MPIPPQGGQIATAHFEKLANLDETVWQHVPASTCKILAKLVVHQVQRNLVRCPETLQSRPFPKLHRALPPSALEIEVRTFNCLTRRFGEDLHPLNDLYIRDLLALAGFGAQTLVDLLVALESITAKPERFEPVKMARVTEINTDRIPISELPSEFRVEISRFPRKGHRIAPRALSHILDTPAKDRRMGGLKLRDLDESVWERFEPKTCNKLALEVIHRIKEFRSALRSQFGGARLPMPRARGKTAVLQLQQRTFNCLNRAGLLKNPVRLAETTFSGLFAMPGFGDISFVDLLCALETQAATGHRATQRVLAAAHRLTKSKDSASIRPDDPRFGLMIQSLAVPGENLKQITEEIAHSTTCASPPRLFAQHLDDLLLKIRASKQLQLEDELAELLSFEPKPRNRELVAANLGWDGKGTHTLEEVGLHYGMTRERVRQIMQRLVDILKAKRPFLPVLDRALQAIAEEIPCSLDRVERMLTERNFTRTRFRYSGLISAADVTHRRCSFIVEDVGGGKFAVTPDQLGVGKTVLHLTRKSISHWGASTTEDIAAQVSDHLRRAISPSFVKAVLCTQKAFSWLDESSGWFWIKSTARNALLNQIQKVICVAPRIQVSELRAGVSRHHRREGFAPPQRVLMALCAQTEGYATEENWILASTPLNHREVLSETESIIVEVLLQHGPVMQKPKLEELCVEKGLLSETLSIHLTYSPVIARYARGVYGLRGALIPPGLAESLVDLRRKTRVLSDYGWLPDGRIFLSYKLSQASLSNGIVSVPAGMKSHLQGGFELLIADQQPAGRLVIKDSQAWGLGPLFRRRGGEPGDLFQIVFDTKRRLASAHLGEALDDESRV